jgi:hypothetical protein
MKRTAQTLLVLAIASITSLALAQETGPTAEQMKDTFPAAPYSPYAGANIPTRVFWGDTHLHTSYSFDAGAFGARLGPPDAYRFARGEEVTTSTGQRARLSRPLDFLVVADHSDNMGLFGRILSSDPTILADPEGRRLHDQIQAGGEGAASAALELIDRFSKGTLPEPMWSLPGSRAYRAAWQDTIDAAEQFNQPGRFTAFIGYEWTSNTGGNNLHRVVIFRDDGAKTSQIEPYTTFAPAGSDKPEDLWKALQAYEDKTGGQVLAIAHNGNLSNGGMFPLVDSAGNAISKQYAQTRIDWEPLYEATQMKGDGEAHPFLSPNDEFANYETWDQGNLNLSVAKQPEMLQYEYARSALKIGLQLEQNTGVNPYKFGMIGATDSHTALATAEEDNFFGKMAAYEPSASRAMHDIVFPGSDLKLVSWQMVASGYAGVWARDNTREALFDAMERKEVYATTGSRMLVRLFGGWEFEANDATNRTPAQIGYRKGVPMGGDLRKAPAGKAPTFLVAALKDPIGANLDRYQIVKGWLDAMGESHEKVYDVVWSGDRKPGADGKLPAVGNTVDVPNASWTNTIGSPELIAVWTDPDFDPAQRAFYYGRVIEIPTPRWTAYDAKKFGIELPAEVPMITTERAYTSPIWYTPGI